MCCDGLMMEPRFHRLEVCVCVRRACVTTCTLTGWPDGATKPPPCRDPRFSRVKVVTDTASPMRDPSELGHSQSLPSSPMRDSAFPSATRLQAYLPKISRIRRCCSIRRLAFAASKEHPLSSLRCVQGHFRMLPPGCCHFQAAS
jgi:hypothetical protein